MKLLLFIFLFNASTLLTAQQITLGFDHHALAVKNIAVSVEFYETVLHLKKIDTPADNPLIKWFSLGNNHQLHLIETKDLDIKTHKSNHFSLHVENIYDFVSYLKSKNIPFWDWVGNKNVIAVRPDGVNQVYIQDPDGYWIEVNDATN